MSVGVQDDVSQTLLYGKRPAFAKFSLKLEDRWTLLSVKLSVAGLGINV